MSTMSRWAATSARDWGRYFSTQGEDLTAAAAESGALPLECGGAAASMSIGAVVAAPAMAEQREETLVFGGGNDWRQFQTLVASARSVESSRCTGVAYLTSSSHVAGPAQLV